MGSVSPNSSVHVEADFSVPEHGLNFRQLVEEWFRNSIRELAGGELDPFAHSLDLGGRESVFKESGAPHGAPGDLWGTLWLTKSLKSGRKRSGRFWSPKNWNNFLRDIEKIPIEADIRLAVIGSDGFPGDVWINISAKRDYDAPGWVALMADRSAEEFTRVDTAIESQLRWKNFLKQQLNSSPTCLFGCIADDVDTTSNRTSLESALGIFQDQSFPAMDSTLRGYSWITVCSPGVADRLGGIESMRRTGAFADISALPGGGLLLQASHDMREYCDEHIRAVFDALRPALPPGMPSRFISKRSLRLVFEEA